MFFGVRVWLEVLSAEHLYLTSIPLLFVGQSKIPCVLAASANFGGFLFILMGGVTPLRGGGAHSGAPPSARIVMVLACPPLGVLVSSCT